MKINLSETQLNNIFETNYNFHYGKEHNGEPYRSESKYVCYHETGQFGSGTYFSTYNNSYEKKDALEKYGENHKNQNPQFIQMDNGVYRVDFDLYKNLYRVYTEEQGDVLHTLCGDLNRFYHKVSGFGLGDYYPKQADFNNSIIYQRIARNAQFIGLECPNYMKLTRMAQEHAKSDDRQSFSTVFMEYNGYNGVNVSGVDKFDNSRHGSVIYDLSKTSDESIQKITPRPRTVGYGHTNSIAYDMWKGFGDEVIAKSLLGKFDGVFFDKLSQKEKYRVIKNVINRNTDIDIKRLKYYLEKEPQLENYVFRQMFNHNVDEDVVMDFDTMEYIVSKNQLYFVNYVPESWNNRRKSFLIEFLDEYKYKNWNATNEELKQHLDKMLGLLKRPLTDSETEYIQNDYYNEEENDNINESFNSYKYRLGQEITNKIPNWNYDAWSNEEDKENQEKLQQLIKKDNFSLYDINDEKSNNGFKNKLQQLGFHHTTTKQEYEGNRHHYTLEWIEKEKYNTIANKLQSLLNSYGWIIVKQNEYFSYEHGIECISFMFEPKYGNQERTQETYFHATPTKKVNKILKQGLVPKDDGKRNEYRSPRIYLTKYMDESLFSALDIDDYTILKINLNGLTDKIKVYTDELAEDAVYTYDNIPPQCITIPRQPHKEREENIKYLQSEIESVSPNLKIENHGQIAIVEGNVNVDETTNAIVNIKIYPRPMVSWGWHKDWNLEGTKTKKQNGKKRTTKIQKGFNNINDLIKYFKLWLLK